MHCWRSLWWPLAWWGLPQTGERKLVFAVARIVVSFPDGASQLSLDLAGYPLSLFPVCKHYYCCTTSALPLYYEYCGFIILWSCCLSLHFDDADSINSVYLSTLSRVEAVKIRSEVYFYICISWRTLWILCSFAVVCGSHLCCWCCCCCLTVIGKGRKVLHYHSAIEQ